MIIFSPICMKSFCILYKAKSFFLEEMEAVL